MIDPRKNRVIVWVISIDMDNDEGDSGNPLIMPMAVIQKWVS